MMLRACKRNDGLSRFKINRPTDVHRGTTELPDGVLGQALSVSLERDEGDARRRRDVKRTTR